MGEKGSSAVHQTVSQCSILYIAYRSTAAVVVEVVWCPVLLCFLLLEIFISLRPSDKTTLLPAVLLCCCATAADAERGGIRGAGGLRCCCCRSPYSCITPGLKSSSSYTKTHTRCCNKPIPGVVTFISRMNYTSHREGGQMFNHLQDCPALTSNGGVHGFSKSRICRSSFAAKDPLMMHPHV